MREPVTPEELWAMLHDAEGRQIGPVTRMGRYVVMGHDRIRAQERIDELSEAGPVEAAVYGRPSDTSTQGMLAFFKERQIPATFRDVDAQPLSVDELWKLVALPGQNVMTP